MTLSVTGEERHTAEADRGFVLDTSGEVHCPGFFHKFSRIPVRWSDLDPFTQGYVEALLRAANDVAWPAYGSKPPPPSILDVRFSDLAPETLAAILKDCADFYGGEVKPLPGSFNQSTAMDGRLFWIVRQDGGYPVKFPPLTVFLGDDGLIYLRAEAQP